MTDQSRGRREKPTRDPEPAPKTDSSGGVPLTPRLAELVESPREFAPDDRFRHLRLATWKATGSTVVIKTFPKTNSDLEKVWQLWKSADERYVTRLLYTEMARFRGAGTSFWCFEVTEHHPHGSLHDYVNKLDGHQLGEEQARAVLAQLTEALDYLHTSIAFGDRPQNLVHCDIKPGNILVRAAEPLDLVLTDFGSARLIMTERKVETTGLTVPYAAPEARWNLAPQIDWWSLGISMIELIQGAHPYVNPTNLDWLPDPEISARVQDQQVPISPTLDPRWQNLLRGLTSWRKDQRWAARKVWEWLRGLDPKVDSSIGPPGARRRPFQFAGRSLHDPRELAQAMSTNWGAAAALVIGSGWSELLRWSRRISPQLRADLDEVKREFIDKRRHVDLIVSETIVRLDRFGRPSYRGERLETKDLAELARRAEEGDEAATELVLSLNESGSLSALGRLQAHHNLADIDTNWRSALDVVLPRTTDIPSWTEETDHPALVIKILRACVSEDYATSMRKQVDRLVTERAARHTQWFTALAKAARSGAPTLPMDALVAVSAPILIRTGRESDPDLHNEAAQDLGVAASAAPRPRHQAQPPAPRTEKSVWRIWPRRPARPGFRRTRLTRRRMLELLGIVLAGALLPVIAGAGVGLSTSIAQGLLAGCAFVVGAGLLWLAVNLRPSRLRGALFGGWLGMVFGYATALIALVALGWSLGAAAGWPAFWTVWVGIVMAMTARGAAR